MELDVVVYACNLSTWKVEAGESRVNFDSKVSSRPTSATWASAPPPPPKKKQKKNLCVFGQDLEHLNGGTYIYYPNPGKTEAWGSQWALSLFLQRTQVQSQGSTALFWPPWVCTINVGKIVIHIKQNEYFLKDKKNPNPKTIKATIKAREKQATNRLRKSCQRSSCIS